jgi:hypothetical protein
MREFESFVLRTHGLAVRWLGHKCLALTRGGEVDMECDIYKTRDTVRLRVRSDLDVPGSRLRRFLQLFRFHLTASNPQRRARSLDTFVNREGECKRARCFQYMRDAFPQEWKQFSGQEGIAPAVQKIRETTESHEETTSKWPIIVNANTSGNSGGDRIAGAVERLIGMLADPVVQFGGSQRKAPPDMAEHLKRFNDGLQVVVDEAAANPAYASCCELDEGKNKL